MLAVKLGVSGALLALLFSRVDVAKLWANARQASPAWILVALALYTLTTVASVWRWSLLLDAQDVPVPFHTLFGSFSVALFFNNFLPSNIGGDVVRIADTAKIARSKTLAATVVLADRIMGMMALILVAASGATFAAAAHGHGVLPIAPVWLWAALACGLAGGVPVLLFPSLAGLLLRPLLVIHPEWVGGRIGTITNTLKRFRRHLGPVVTCFFGAVFVQMATVAFHFAVAHALGIHISVFDIAVVVPMAGVVQMLPVSVNGFGVREAMFSFYFSRIGLPIEQAILLSLTATALVMLYSLTGALVLVGRGHR